MANERVLLVEDEAIARLDIKAALEKVGYSIVGFAESGEEAVRLADELNPDIVLMDIQLQGEMDGVEAANEITRRFDLPVIYLTGFVDDETLRWAKVTGPYGYLLKPVNHNELHPAIEVGLYRHQMERELRKAKLAAEAASRAKTSFLATVSHELRTPMNGVLGMTELLLMSDLGEPYRENVQLIKDSSLSLLAVLNQIIDYSKLETSAVRLRAMDFRLEDMVTGLLSQYKRPASTKGISLDYSISPEVPGWVRGDSGKLRQIIGNLINNAVKFTASGLVMVDISPASNGDPILDEEDVVLVQILVQDTGVGVPVDKLQDIFESFEKAEDYLLHSNGALGLGLAIANRLAHLMGGTIRCSSEEGKGSVFSVIVPLTRSKYEEHSPTEAIMSDEKPLFGATVLVVEDDLVNQRYLVRLLEKLGCQVELAEDGLKAIGALKENKYDLVLMDVEMPHMNGIEATRLIRQPDTGCLNPDVPIIALTARAMWGDEQRCIHAGMNDYISKPVDMDTVAAIIQSTLENG